jgi:L-2-hydroxycarboxylate dehydrogenase (NAD+)
MTELNEFAYLDLDTLYNFTKDVFIGVGVPEKDATICADVLVEADKRGIESHGCARLQMYYERIKRKQQLPITKLTTVREAPATIRLNANNGMGQVAAKKAMQIAIGKAKKYGIGMAVVENSNHFGIAGYYALMATEQDCIGICGTNTRPAIAPTWSVEPMLGTNPLTIGVPTDWDFPWIADHATSITQRGKVETYARLGKPLIEGWVIDETGNAATDSKEVLLDLMKDKAALTPIGGIGEEMGGHKGYNYATFVEIMSACLNQANMLKACIGLDANGKNIPYNLGHFFIAVNPAAFCEIAAFKKKTGDLLRQLAGAKKQPGADHIYVAGEKEYFAFQRLQQTGVPFSKVTQRQILLMQKELGLTKYKFDFKVDIAQKDETGW